MADDGDDLIRSRAYEIWEAEGSPHGRDADHWNQASREIAEAKAEGSVEAPLPVAPPVAGDPASAPEAAAPARRGRKAQAAARVTPVSKGRRKKDG